MTTYEPGTVARVTYGGLKTIGFSVGRGGWLLLSEGKHDYYHVDSAVITDITPLVCIEASREDADALLRDEPKIMLAIEPGRTSDFLVRALHAIREQISKPKRWTVGAGCDCADEQMFWLYDDGKCTNARGSVRGEMQSLADVLNAAEREGQAS